MLARTVLLCCCLAVRAAVAQESHWRPFPTARLFPTAIADPTTTQFGLSFLSVPTPSIQAAGQFRSELRLGGQFGLVRWRPAGDVGWALQASLEAGFNGQFDASDEYDQLGWDGIYGLTLSAAAPGGLALKLGGKHTSSHLGDEYIEDNERERINYTREEVIAGASWPVTRLLRLYGEVGWGFRLRSPELMAPWRLQGGAELTHAGLFGAEHLGWYGALDLSGWQERDWRLDVSAQAGISYQASDRRWRAGIGYRDGRVPVGELFHDTERAWSIGLYLDL
jgi:hypothetical protein